MDPKSVSNASSSSPFSSSTAPSTMAPKKKPGAAAHPSTSKAPPPAASNTAGGAEVHEDADADGEVAGAGGAVTTSPAADARSGGTGGEQHQQHLDGHAPQGTGEGVTPSAPLSPADRHSHNNGAPTGANRRPPAAPTTSAVAARTPPAGRADQAAAPNGATSPQAPSPHHVEVVAPQQQRGRNTTAAGTVRSRATVRSTSSSPLPSTTSEAMARAQLLLRFLPAAEHMDEWHSTIQSLFIFTEAGGSRRAGPPQPPQATAIAPHTRGAIPMVQSPPR